MNISSRYSNSNFARSFYFHCLSNFAKNINLSCRVSLWFEFNLHLEGWSMDNNMVSKIGVVMSSTKICLLQFKI